MTPAARALEAGAEAMHGGCAEVGPHRLHLGRCEDVLPTLPAASVDVVCASPPYNLGVRYGQSAGGDDMEEDAYLDWFAGVAVSLARVMRTGGSFFLNVGSIPSKPWLPFALPMRLRALRRADGKPLFVLQNRIVWAKSITVAGETRGQFKPLNSRRYLNDTHEFLLHFTLGGDVPLDRHAIGVPYADRANLARFGVAGRADVRCRGNTWFVPYDTVQSRAERFGHPASFPVALPRWAIRLHGVARPIVLDPFSGTGTTALAAQLEGGVGWAIELDRGYHAAAVSRLRAALGAFASDPATAGLCASDLAAEVERG